MTVRTFVLVALASVTLAGTAMADEGINITPTLYREQARATAAMRPAFELTTTPSLTPRAPAAQRVVADISKLGRHRTLRCWGDPVTAQRRAFAPPLRVGWAVATQAVTDGNRSQSSLRY